MLILVTACVAVYYPIFFNDFLYYWDDQWVLMNRYTEGGLNFRNLWAILTNYYHGQYAPVNEYFYLIQHTLFGYNPMMFHLTSLLVHIGCVCLTYTVITRIVAQVKDAKTESTHLIAFAASLLFAVHPMNVESVAWVSASKILLYAFFYLAATYTYIIYMERKRTGFYVLTLLLFTLSFGAKEQAVTFPVWLLMLYWICGYSFKDRKIWLHVTPFLALAIFFGVITMLSQAAAGGGALSKAIQYPLWQRFILGCYTFFEYFSKFLFPYKLLHVYPFPTLINEPLHEWMMLYPVLLFIMITALWRYITKMPLAAGLMFFFVHIAIVLHIIPISRYAIIADRYIYVASIGLAFLVAWYFTWLITNCKGLIRNAVTGAFVCIVLSLGIYSNFRSRKWKDTESIKRDLREIIKQRNDHVPEFEELMKEEIINN